MLVDAVNHRDREGGTETTVLGPFYVGEHQSMHHGEDISNDYDGEPLFVDARVTDLAGRPLRDVRVDVWHADDEGLYDSQKEAYAAHGPTMRARFSTDDEGRFYFRSIKPCSYPIPMDGPVGELIRAANRHPMRPAHIHFLIEAQGFSPLVTHVFVDGDEYLHSDAVFGVKNELIAQLERRTERELPDGTPIEGPWHRMAFEFRLKPGAGVAPKPILAVVE